MLKNLRNWAIKSNPFNSRKYVGKDLIGNMYFEEPTQGRGRRTIQYQDGRNHISQYEANDIPVECQSWLRHTREKFPSLEQLEHNQKVAQDIQQRVKNEVN